MNLFHLFAAIVGTLSIYSFGHIALIIVRGKYSDLGQHKVKNSNTTYQTTSNSQVQRVFVPYEHQFPCFIEQDERSGESLRGLIYIKVPKAASSTLAGINLRIAHRHVPKSINVSKCTSTYLHVKATDFKVKFRNRKHNFLWTFIRDPKAQLISNLFFTWKAHIAKGNEPKFANLKKFVKYNHLKQLEYITISPIDNRLDNNVSKSALFQEILDGYDFLGTSERFDESLVALRFMLGLDAGDILYVNAKKSGAYHYQNDECTKIPQKKIWAKQDEYFNSYSFIKRITPMNEFYQAVNKSLDLTIDRIGRDKFNEALSEHKRLMTLADAICSPRAIFPCTEEGIPQLDKSEHSCYHKDHGCAYSCLDALYYNISNNIPLQRVESSNSISNSKDVIVASDRNNIASNDKSHFRDSHVRPDTISEPQRVFTPYKNQFPCYPESKGVGKGLRGLIFIKVPKAASSTLAGINLRIAHRHVPRSMNISKCAATYLHIEATELKVNKRPKKKTFLWTFIRDPKSQMISNLFFIWKTKINDEGKHPTLSDFQRYVDHSYRKQLNFIQIKDFNETIMTKVNRSIMFQEILNKYNFLGIVERFDESLVALRLLLGLDAGDILYIAAKKSGGYHHQYGRCIKIPRPKTNYWPNKEKYFTSSNWTNKITPLNEFYQAVNKSLDLTIKKIGQAKFNIALKEHLDLISLADKVCSTKAIFPCADDGIDQLNKSMNDCFYKDHGCGYRCLDELYDNVSKLYS